MGHRSPLDTESEVCLSVKIKLEVINFLKWEDFLSLYYQFDLNSTVLNASSDSSANLEGDWSVPGFQDLYIYVIIFMCSRQAATTNKFIKWCNFFETMPH